MTTQSARSKIIQKIATTEHKLDRLDFKKLHFVETMDQVLAIAFEQPLPQQPAVETAQPIASLTPPTEGTAAHQ